MNFNRLKHEKSVPKWLARKQIPMLNHDLYSSYLMCSKEPIFSQLKTSIRKWQSYLKHFHRMTSGDALRPGNFVWGSV